MTAEQLKELRRKRDETLAEREKLVESVIAEERGYTEEERERNAKLLQRNKDLDEQIREGDELVKQREGYDAGTPDLSDESGSDEGGHRGADGKSHMYRSVAHLARDIMLAKKGEQRTEALGRYEKRMAEQMRAMNITDGTSAGMMIMDEFEQGVNRLTGTGGWVRQRARVIPAGEYPDGRFTKLVRKQGSGGAYNGIEINSIGEGKASGEDSHLVHDLFVLDPANKKKQARYYVTQDTLNNPTAVARDLEEGFAGARAEWEDERAIKGTGAGEPMGVLNFEAARGVDRDTSSQFNFADVLKMRKHMYPRATTFNWEVSLDLYEEVAGMKDGNERLIMLAGDATRGVPDLLHGRPIHWSEVNPAAGDRGDVMLVDWSYYYIKEGSGPYLTVNPYYDTDREIVATYLTWKMDADTWVREPLTLKNGMTVSPFVVLEG